MAQTFFLSIQNLTENEKYRLSRQLQKYIHVFLYEDCHSWAGLKDNYGYGEMRMMFRGKRIRLKAHRVVFALAYPCIYQQSPTNDVSHLCHNRLCVNLKHLSLNPIA